MTSKALHLLLVVAVVAYLAAPAAAQGVRWEVTVGFDNTLKEGAWTPISVDISNDGPSRSGELLVPVSYGRPAVRSVNYTVPVDLPRHSKKRYTLCVPSEYLEQVHLKLDGLRLQSRNLPPTREASPYDSLLVVLGGDPGLLNFLTGTRAAPGIEWADRLPVSEYDFGPFGYQSGTPLSPSEGDIQVGHADWSGLPESWLAWDAVDTVVLGDADFRAASPEALDALLRWLQLGGTLVVPGGALSPQMAASPIAHLLPISITATTTLPDLAPLGRWAEQPIDPRSVLVADGDLRPDADLLCGTRAQPLIAARPVGSGQVVFTAFDFAAAPVKYWDGQTSMWPRLLAQAPAPPSLAAPAEHSARWDPAPSLRDAATYTPAAELPPIWLILGFLAAYIIVLVPVNYYLLKRLDRREFAWLTTPVIVVVFTLVAYGVGYSLRGGEIVLNRLGVIEVASGAGLARGRGYIGIFSPGRTSYDLLLQGAAAGARDLAFAGERTRGTPTVHYGPAPQIADVAMNMWSTRAFGVEFLTDLQDGISGVLEYDNADLRATVTNNTGLRLRQCRIIKQHSEGQKKNIRPGEEVLLSFGGGSPIRDQSWPHRSRRYTRTNVEEVIADIAVEALFSEDRAAYGGPAPPAASLSAHPYLVAIVDDPLVPVELAGRRATLNDTNIIIVRLPVRLVAGQHISVPPWLITSRLIVSDAGFTAHDRWEPGFTLEEGVAVFEFRVPLGERGGRATALSLVSPFEAHPASSSPTSGLSRSTRGSGMRGGPVSGPSLPAPGGGQTPGLTISAHNFARDLWQPLPTTVQPITFPDPANCMSSDGRVLLKIAIPSGDLYLETLDLSAEVTTF